MSSGSGDSIFKLITTLCQQMCNDYNKKRTYGCASLGDKAVKKLRKSAFEILLRKSKDNEDLEDQSQYDPMREFLFHQFDMRLSAQTAFDRDRCDELEKCLENLIPEHFQTDNGQAILIFLLSLKNSVVTDAESSVMDLYPFGFYSALKSCSETNPYISISPGMYQIPRKLQIYAENQYRVRNPYMPNPIMFVTPESQKFQQIDYFFKLNFDLPPIKRQRKLFGPLLTLPSVEENDEKAFKNEKSQESRKFHQCLTWTRLGSKTDGPIFEKPFLTEHKDSLFHILSFIKYGQNQKFQAKVVKNHIFLDDIKYLCTGVRSDSFKYNPHNVTFELATKDLTLENLAPSTVEAYLREFLQFGNCFKRLELMTNLDPNTLQLPVSGFVFKALSKTINKFLFSVRHFVFSQSREHQEETLLEFTLRVKKIQEMVLFFAKLMDIDADDLSCDQFPHGSNLLMYLHNNLMDEVARRNRMASLISILRDCCQVYYQLYDKWVFAGYLVDPHKELFICASDQCQIRTKYNFDRSFFVQKNQAPLFLRGFEQDLLSCGKYTMLLREYKANHKLFAIKNTPKIRVCLSYEEIESVKMECQNYLKEAYKMCGGKMQIKKLFEDLRKKQTDLKKATSERFIVNLKKWHEEMELERENALELKRIQLENLQRQIDEKKSSLLEKRKEELDLEIRCEEYNQALEGKELDKIASDRMKRVEYYKELNEMIDAKKEKVDKVVQKLKVQLKDEETVNKNYKKSIEEKNKEPKTPSELEINKKKQLGSDLDQILDENFNQKIVVKVPETKTEAQRNKMKVLTEEFNLKSYENCDNKENAIEELKKQNLTEAQKNKMKSMSSEFNNNEPVEENDVILILDENNLSERQKNRFSAMSHHLTDNYFKQQPQEMVTPLDNKNLTELQRNRLKVMSHEYGMNISIEKELADEFETETMTELQRNRKKILCRSDNFREDLNLDLSNISEREKNKRKYLEFELNQGSKTPTAVTPMSITSDPTDSESRTNLPISSNVSEIMSNGNNLNENGGISGDESQFLTEIEEIVKPKRQSFIEFIRTIIPNENEAFFEFSETDENENSLPKYDLKTLSSLTFENVTMFLQQSLVIPLKTQLELVNNEILKVFLLDLDIYSHFNSLKNYFFLMDGEFGIYICEGLISKLENGAKPIHLYSYQTLNIILEQAFGASVIGKDKNASLLSFALGKVPEDSFDLNSPNVLNDLKLVYNVDWPLNLVLCQKTIQQYCHIFQYLLKVRRISWILENVCYKSLKYDVKVMGNGLLRSKQYKHVQLIRHKLSQFINCLKNHITSSAIQGSWKRFNDQLEKVTSMVDLYNKHTDYIKQIRFLCMLNRQSQEFHNVIEDIFIIILRFNSHLKSKAWTKAKKDASNSGDLSEFVHTNYEKLCKDEQDFDKLCNYVVYLGGKIVKRGYQTELNEFLNLVNINSFYQGVVGAPSVSGSSS